MKLPRPLALAMFWVPAVAVSLLVASLISAPDGLGKPEADPWWCWGAQRYEAQAHAWPVCTEQQVAWWNKREPKWAKRRRPNERLTCSGSGYGADCPRWYYDPAAARRFGCIDTYINDKGEDTGECR